MNIKKEIERDTLLCSRMMLWRTACIVMSIPFLIQTLLSLATGSHTTLDWTFGLFAIPLIPLNYYLIRLVTKTNGITSAIFHALLTAILAPFFLIGPLLIPLLVRGDARRLMIVQNTENAG
jgi:hypothetical protein